MREFVKLEIHQINADKRRLELPNFGSYAQERKKGFKPLINWLANGADLDKARFQVQKIGEVAKGTAMPKAWCDAVDRGNREEYFIALGVQRESVRGKDPQVILNFIDGSYQLSLLNEEYFVLTLVKVWKKPKKFWPK